jgi:tetratricopeptide (TPR) repeat protein
LKGDVEGRFFNVTKPSYVKMKISKHRPLFLYLCTVVFLVLVLVLTGIAFEIPFSVPTVFGVAGTIFAYYLYTKKQDEKEVKKEEKTEEKEIAVPKPLTPYFAHPYLMHKNFTGRQKERKELTEWLKDDYTPVFVYVAMGGMGKSALAWHWLTEDILGSDEQPRKIVWWSFYDRESGFGRFLKKAIEYFSDDGGDWSSLESRRDQMEHLRKILRDNRFLLVLDGVERMLRAYYSLESPYQSDEIEEVRAVGEDFRSCIDPNFGMFLQWLASGNLRTKTLLTSRLYPKELDDLEGSWRKDLKEMDRDDAVLFFRSRGVVGTSAEIGAACGEVGYHPLSLRLLSGLIVHDPRNPGDIQEWRKYNVIPDLKGREGHNIMDLAYDSLDEEKQALISKLSAFRNPMDYDATNIFNDFGNEGRFNEALLELVDRGLLFRDEARNRFDLHPVVRKYCYEQLNDNGAVHAKLIEYFAEIPELDEIRTVDDLAPVIELYHHRVRAGRYDEARRLFEKKLNHDLFYTFGEYQTIIELLHALFPDGENKLPRLADEVDQARTLNAIAISYALLGQSRHAMQLLGVQISIWEKRGNKELLALGLGDMALSQIRIGELEAAESSIRRRIKISCEVGPELREAIGRQILGQLLACQEKFEESEKELTIALNLFIKLDKVALQCLVWIHRSTRSLLMSNAEEALRYATKAREMAETEYRKRNIIRAEWLLGAAHLMKGDLVEADEHLSDALTRDRKINLVELEPDILLEFAKLRFKENRNEEALKFADEALQIADRCEYRLKQADIHNFLAEFYLDSGDRKKARSHGIIAKERAECGYKPALERAEELLVAIGEDQTRS